jgi:hypothetical protein
MDASPVSMMPSGYRGSVRFAAGSQSSVTDDGEDRPMTAGTIGFCCVVAGVRFVAAR